MKGNKPACIALSSPINAERCNTPQTNIMVAPIKTESVIPNISFLRILFKRNAMKKEDMTIP